MDKTVFINHLNNREYKEIESQLLSKYRYDDKSKLMLAVCYSEQYEKREEATKLYKELIRTSYKKAFMYSFIARYSQNLEEKIRSFFYLNNIEKIEVYQNLS